MKDMDTYEKAWHLVDILKLKLKSMLYVYISILIYKLSSIVIKKNNQYIDISI